MFAIRFADGSKIALLFGRSYVTVPATGVPACANEKFADTIVAEFIALVKVAVMLSFMATPVATLAGTVENTVGGVVSVAEPVVNFHTIFAANASPPRAFAPVVIVAVWDWLTASGADGVKIAVLFASS